MHPTTTLMLVKSIERERYESARRPPRPSPATIPAQPSRPSLWTEMLRVYRVGFAGRP